MSQKKKFVSNIFRDIMGGVVFWGGCALCGFITLRIWSTPWLGIVAWMALYYMYRWLIGHWKSAGSARE